MSAAVLKRRPLKDPKKLSFVGELSLQRGRVHEFCGPARATAAMLLARDVDGPILWISPVYGTDRLHSEGVRAFIDPAQLIYVSPDRAPDLLWSMEEVLRSGVVPLVIADLQSAPALTPIRRLTLAAETGTALTGAPPTGIVLTPGDGGASGIESRWHLTPRHHGEDRCWHLERRRARMEPPKAWGLIAKDGDFQTEPAAPIAI